MKRNLLLVDSDERSRRLLEVSLRKAGYVPTCAQSGDEARALIGALPPDLIVTESRLPDRDGLEFIAELVRDEETKGIPVLVVSHDGSMETKVRCLELGVSDYLTKPVFIKEVMTRVGLALDRRTLIPPEANSSLRGSLSQLGLLDLLRSIEINRHSGVVRLLSHDRAGALFFSDGAPVDARVDDARGTDAIRRLILWNDGKFAVEFRPVRTDESKLALSMQELLVEAVQRIDQWERELEQLPTLQAILEVDEDVLVRFLSEIPDEANDVLRLVNGQRALFDVVFDAPGDPLVAIETVARLFFDGVVRDTARRIPNPDDSAEIPLLEELVPGADREETNDRDQATVTSVPSRAAFDSRRHEKKPEFSQGKPGTPTAGEESRQRVLESPGSSTNNTRPAESDDEEDNMVRKPRRKRRSRRATAKYLYEALETNVIQFPAQSKVAVSTQVAVGDRIGVSARSEREPLLPDAERRRSDAAPKSDPVEVLESEAETVPPPAQERAVRDTMRAFASAPVPTESPLEPPTLEELPSEVNDTASPPSAEAEDETEVSPGRKVSRAKKAKRRAKKQGTTSSQMIRAITSTGAHAAVAESFFSSAPPPNPQDEAETWEDLKAEFDVLTPIMRKARFFTFVSLGVAAVVFGGFLLVNKVLLPQPDEQLGTGGELQLPTPATMEQTTPASATTQTEASSTEEIPAVPAGESVTADPAELVDPELAETPEAVEAAPIEEPTLEETPAEEIAETEAAVESVIQEPEPAAGADVAPEPAPAEPLASDYTGLLEQAQGLVRSRTTREDGIAAYRRAIEINPQGHEALADLALVMLEDRNNEEARNLAQRATLIDRTNAKAWVTLGAALQALGDRESANLAYHNCVEHGVGPMVRECRLVAR